MDEWMDGRTDGQGGREGEREGRKMARYIGVSFCQHHKHLQRPTPLSFYSLTFYSTHILLTFTVNLSPLPKLAKEISKST